MAAGMWDASLMFFQQPQTAGQGTTRVPFLPTWESVLFHKVIKAAPTAFCTGNDERTQPVWRALSLLRLNHVLAFCHGSARHGSLKHTFIAFSRKRTKRSGRCVRKGSCRGGGVEETVNLNHWSISPAWHSSLSTLESVNMSSRVRKKGM